MTAVLIWTADLWIKQFNDSNIRHSALDARKITLSFYSRTRNGSVRLATESVSAEKVLFSYANIMEYGGQILTRSKQGWLHYGLKLRFAFVLTRLISLPRIHLWGIIGIFHTCIFVVTNILVYFGGAQRSKSIRPSPSRNSI